MEDVAHCAVHAGRPTKYVCPCKNFLLCETCKKKHVSDTQHAPESCKDVGLAILHQRIQDANGRQAEELAKGLKMALKEFEDGLLREIDRFQESCMQTEELRTMRKLGSKGRYAELYFYAKNLPADGAKNEAAVEELNKRLLETIDQASDGLKKVLKRFVVVAQYKPVFAAYKKDEVLVIDDKSHDDEEQVVSALKTADMSKLKAMYIEPWPVTGDRVALELASRLQTHPVSALYLGDCIVSDTGAAKLAQAACRGKLLSAFGIVSAKISDTGAKAVAEAVKGCPLSVFYLGSFNISDSGAKAVAEAMKDCSLSVFYLASSKISDSGAKAVAEAMKDCPLSAFCLFGGEISDAGAIAVANAVKDCPLSVFYLYGIKISDPGATAVAETLSSGGCASTLSAFYLGGNRISDSGAKKVADAVRGCTRLSVFHLDSELISGETLAYILGSMAGVSTIRSLSLCISKIGKMQMDSCLSRMQQSGVQNSSRFDSDATPRSRRLCARSLQPNGMRN